MKKGFSLINFYLFWTLLFSGLLLMLLSGCDTRSSEEESAIAKCRMMLKKGWPADSQKRAKRALSQWENGIVDPVPILIDVRLATPKEKKETMLALAISDEDKDLVGVGVREQHLKTDGTKPKIIEEVYSVFGSCSPVSVSYFAIPIRIRESASDIKDDKLWENYVESGEFAPEAMPPLLVSVPDHNRVDVWVWLYDRAGHKSETVRLHNRISTAP